MVARPEELNDVYKPSVHDDELEIKTPMRLRVSILKYLK